MLSVNPLLSEDTVFLCFCFIVTIRGVLHVLSHDEEAIASVLTSGYAGSPCMHTSIPCSYTSNEKSSSITLKLLESSKGTMNYLRFKLKEFFFTFFKDNYQRIIKAPSWSNPKRERSIL